MKLDHIHKYADLAWLGLDDIHNIQVSDIFAPAVSQDETTSAYEFLKIISQKDYLHVVCKEILNVQLLPIQNVIIQELWTRTFPMYIATRGFGKTFLMAVICILKALLIPGTKVVITGAGFRQAKLVMEYIESIWRNAPILKDICDENSGSSHEPDRYTFTINDSIIIAIPLGDGQKIRGLRATLICADEFGSIRPDIYETVIQGFAAVRKDPIDNVMMAARRRYLMKKGEWNESQQNQFEQNLGNQSIISGTAGFDFEHFANYWKKYHGIISGDKASMIDMLGEEMADKFDPRDFSIIRIPYDLIPEDFMDDKMVMRAKSMTHSGLFLNEYGAVFTKDSLGFFKRTLIEACVASESNKINIPGYGTIVYDAIISGGSKKRYIIGIDPAASVDNLAIVIIELYDNHWRVVYGWTTNAKEHQKQLKAGLTKEEHYYKYCARKIRDLMKVFPTVRIGVDGQGGGKAIMEALHDKDTLEEGESQLWPIIDPDDEQPTDDKPGLHIIEKVEFSSAEWTSEANHGLRKDMESKQLLLPRYDGLTLSLASERDIENGKANYNTDSLEGCIMEIEELKNELSTIVMTQTGVSGRDRWDTPEIKTTTGKKGRLRKDRYSALLIANMLARSMNRAEAPFRMGVVGGIRQELATRKKTGELYYGNEWYKVPPNTFRGISRK